MNEQQIGILVKWVGANWPSAPMPDDTIEVFVLELAGLDFDETLAVLRETFADAPFPPTPMALRSTVLRCRSNVPTYEQAMSELLDRIASVGYAQPEPEWSHPAVAALVRQRGGWTEVCASTPARAAIDAGGLSVFNTWAAQFRDEYRAVAARSDADLARTAIGAGSPGAIEMPDLRYEDD